MNTQTDSLRPLAHPMAEGSRPEPGFESCRWRHALMAFGWVNVALGAIGIVVPGMPTTVFLLIALWAFSKSSERFHDWLYNHKRFGPPIRNWHEHRAIPVRAKIAAVAMMTASLAFVALFVAEGWVLPAGLGAVLGCVAIFIVTRPSEPHPTALGNNA